MYRSAKYAQSETRKNMQIQFHFLFEIMCKMLVCNEKLLFYKNSVMPYSFYFPLLFRISMIKDHNLICGKNDCPFYNLPSAVRNHTTAPCPFEISYSTRQSPPLDDFLLWKYLTNLFLSLGISGFPSSSTSTENKYDSAIAAGHELNKFTAGWVSWF